MKFGNLATAAGPSGEMLAPAKLANLISAGLPQVQADYFFNNKQTYFNSGDKKLVQELSSIWLGLWSDFRTFN